MPLDSEVGLGPGNIVLVGDSAPPRKRGTAAPLIWLMYIVATVANLNYCCALVCDTARLQQLCTLRSGILCR